MTHFDPDAYLQQSTPAFDPDTYLHESDTTSAPNPVSTPARPWWQISLPGRPAPVEPNVDPNLLTNAAKGGLGMVTHAAGNLADVVTGTAPGEGSHAQRWSAPFAVTDPTEQLDASQIGLQRDVSNAYDRVAGTGPAATEIKTRIPQALEAIGTVVPALKGIGGGEAAESAGLSESPQSLGAAKTSPMAGLSPELRQAVQVAAQKTGGAVAPDVLARHVEADSLPVKVQLTEGQATQNPAVLSNEVNSRGKNPAIAQRYNEQNNQLVQNIQALRDKVGPDVFSTNPVEHGDILIKAYQDKAAVADADISQKYQALRDAAGGDFPVSAPSLLKDATKRLNDELLLDHAPKAVMSTLGRLADSDNMTFQNFEALRTNLARTMRSSTDGNERAAAGVIRSAMEDLPLKPGAAELKPLADTARAAARTQFQALEADPAYKAAVNETVSPDRFVQKYVIGGNRDDVATMRQNLADNETATQTMGVAALDHLRKSAGIDPMGNGNFSQAGFNKHLQALSPKMSSLVDPQTAEHLDTLGNVARYTQAQPRGSFVNNSNTFTAMAANHAANVLEGVANVKAGGIPVGTMVRKALGNRAEARATAEALKPGAGLTRLSDIPK